MNEIQQQEDAVRRPRRREWWGIELWLGGLRMTSMLEPLLCLMSVLLYS